MAFQKSNTRRRLHFSVGNFRSIAELSVALPKFSVLVGSNSAGKTNLIDAMTLLGEIVSQRGVRPVRELGWHDVIRRQKRESRELRLSARLRVATSRLRNPMTNFGQNVLVDLPSSLLVDILFVLKKQQNRIGFFKQQVSLLDENEQVILTVHVDRRGVVTTRSENEKTAVAILQVIGSRPSFRQAVAGQQSLVFEEEESGSESEELPEQFDYQIEFSRALMSELVRSLQIRRIRLDASSLRSDAIIPRDTAVSLDSTGRGLALAVERLRGDGKAVPAKFMSVLQDLQRVYPRIEDVLPRRNSKSSITLQIKERGIAEPLDQSNVSDGVLHALALYIALHEPTTGTLAIEEPENALHPWAIRALMDAIQRSPNRIILTTHSEVVVNAIRDPDSLFIVEQGDGGTTITPALEKEHALRAILSESGQGLGDIWVDGMLGGVP